MEIIFEEPQEKKVLIILKGKEVDCLKCDLQALKNIKALRSDTAKLLNKLIEDSK